MPLQAREDFVGFQRSDLPMLRMQAKAQNFAKPGRALDFRAAGDRDAMLSIRFGSHDA